MHRAKAKGLQRGQQVRNKGSQDILGFKGPIWQVRAHKHNFLTRRRVQRAAELLSLQKRPRVTWFCFIWKYATLLHDFVIPIMRKKGCIMLSCTIIKSYEKFSLGFNHYLLWLSSLQFSLALIEKTLLFDAPSHRLLRPSPTHFLFPIPAGVSSAGGPAGW